MKKLLLALSLFCFYSQAQAAAVGTVALLKGKAFQQIEKQSQWLKENDSISENAIVVTLDNSSLKLILNDRSVVNLGPNTSLRMDSIKPASPSVIEVKRGSVRSQVIKDYTQSGANIGSSKPKFFVRTRSATMGVRGTDFTVVFNPENNITSLVTFEGLVSMSKSDEKPQSPERLIELVNSAQAVSVSPGQFSSASPQLTQASIPTKLSPVQFESLKSQEGIKSAAAPQSGGSAAPNKYYSPIPPGVDPKLFVAHKTTADSSLPPPEGFYDKKTGAFAPPAGGFLDLKSGLYISPPPGSAFDANAGVYVPPPAMGKVDPLSGQYVPPQGFQLDPSKGFVPAPGSKPGEQRGPELPQSPGKLAPLGPLAQGMNGAPGLFPPGFLPPGFVPPPGAKLPFRPEDQPLYPVRDPGCMTCGPMLPPPDLMDPNSVTRVKFNITVSP